MSQPQQTMESDRRLHRRLDDQRASLVELGANNSGIILNISEGGMAVLVAEDLNGHGIGTLRFQAPEFEHWIETAAEIAWISESRKQAGICFKGLSEAARTQLRAGISIATTRARLASQITQGGTAPVADQQQTNPATSSLPAAVMVDSQVPIESESIPTANNVNSDVLAGKTVEKTPENEGRAEVSVQSDPKVSAVALDSPLPDERRDTESADKLSLSEDSKEEDSKEENSKKDAQTQLLKSPDTMSQKIPPRPVPLAAPQSALAEMRFRNLVANSGVKQSDTYRGILERTDFTDRKWIVIGAIAVLAALLAFLVGWVLGDPSRMKLGH
jgi:PilZ domain